MFDLVFISEESKLSTYQIAQGFNRRHEQVVRLIRKYKKAFREFGTLSPSASVYGRGRPLEGFCLNYGQVMFLSSLLKTSPAALRFKKILCKSFQEHSGLLVKIKIALQNFDFGDVECRYVYAAQDENGNLKIGISNNPERRLDELNAADASVLKLVYVKKSKSQGYQDEVTAHAAAKQCHIKGEWFTSGALGVLI